MSLAHKLVDAGLWYVALLWFIGFCAQHKRSQKRRLDSPSIHCERSPDWRHSALGSFRRQAE